MKTPESMTDYLKLTDAQKMELIGLPSVPSNALLATDVLAEMDRIMQDHPCAMEYETDTRDTWPSRWGALRGFLAAKRDIANKALTPFDPKS